MRILFFILALASCDPDFVCQDNTPPLTPHTAIEKSCAEWPGYTHEWAVIIRIYPNGAHLRTWFTGSEHEVGIIVPDLTGVEKIIIIHNHVALSENKFSRMDFDAKDWLKARCETEGVELYDVVLFHYGDITSMRKEGWL